MGCMGVICQRRELDDTTEYFTRTQIFKDCQSKCIALTEVSSFMVLIVWVKYLHFVFKLLT